MHSDCFMGQSTPIQRITLCIVVTGQRFMGAVGEFERHRQEHHQFKQHYRGQQKTTTTTTATRIFSRFDSVEEKVQRSRTGSTVGITGTATAGSAGAGAGGAKAVAAGSSRDAGVAAGVLGVGVGLNATGIGGATPRGSISIGNSRVGGRNSFAAESLGGSIGSSIVGRRDSTIGKSRGSISAGAGSSSSSTVGIKKPVGAATTSIATAADTTAATATSTGVPPGSPRARPATLSTVFSKFIDGMPAATMFSKFKSSGSSAGPQNAIETNPITQFFEIGKQVASAGPELVWKIHDAYRKADGKECSIFIFEKKIAEKLHKPRRKETVTELLRASVKQLERFRHPKILQIFHAVEECSDTLAFAAEPVLGSLANILAYHEATNFGAIAGQPNTGTPQHVPTATLPRPPHAKEYYFLDMELKYGILQLTEALAYLHYSGHVLHRNLCPSSILVTKRGTWKLAGLEFIERLNETDLTDSIICQPWSTRVSKMAQPSLDFTAPETQLQSTCSILSDMFSLGMVICAIFNHGRPLIQAGNSSSAYLKQLDLLEDTVHSMISRVPVPLQEAASRLVSRDPTARPTAQLLQLIKYFSDPAVNALKFLDVINMKDPSQKSHFYRTTLKEVIHNIPRKLWWQHVWPVLQAEMHAGEVLAAVLQPVMLLVQESTPEEYEAIIFPALRVVFASPKSIQATVTLLENLHQIIEKTPVDEITTDVMPLLFNSFESSTIQVQGAALIAVANVYGNIDEISIRRMVMPKVKMVFEKNLNDVKIVTNVLTCIERILEKLDKSQVMDDVIPLLWDVRLSDPDIIIRIVNIYRKLLIDKNYGLTVHVMATKIMPTLIPHTVNPSLNLDQYTFLLEVLQEMLDHIDRHQRNKLKLDNLSIPSPERHRTLRHQFSSDNMHAPPFNIPNLRIDQRKTSSAEDMARKNSGGSGMLGGWWFGVSPSSPDSNFLRVANAFPNRRLSDNTLMTPKIRIAPSCASSPGGTPGGGLPIRRHSSIGPQERRGSTINLSPPTAYGFSSRGGSGSSLSVPSSSAYVGGSMPNTSSSVPFLLSSSMQSIRSRRTSTVLSSGPLGSGSGILQQLGSGMVRQLNSVSGTASPVHHLAINGTRTYVRKCPSLNITFSN